MEARAVDDRYCDLVLKGGITSGIVYPLAISRLSERYRFKSIGGTSAGAVAAAAAAAAEYQRRHSASMDGFRALDLLPNDLSVEDEQGRSRLFRLFQPQAGTAPLFRMLIAALGRKSLFSRVAHACARGAIEFWVRCTLGALLFGGASWWAIRAGLPEGVNSGWTIWMLVALLALIGAGLGLVTGIYRCVTRDVVENGFGLCKGIDGSCKSSDDADDQLTPWLHVLINRCAGRDPENDPLTFGDLWSAPGAPPPVPGQQDDCSIDLRMVTTNVTHGRPYKLPFDEPGARVFFRPKELREYFPEPVVKWLAAHAVKYRPVPGSDPELPEGLLQMPDAKNLPVVVATRLSLSYPFLISAVPLWAIDYEAAPGSRTFERCWFSDGGLSSNFPIHLFDDLLPRWPTFGMKLEDFPKGYEARRDRTYMPCLNVEGVADAWNRFDEEKVGLERLKGFASALLDAAMNWNDNVLSRLPGNRDRIARIRLHENEGGMNLDMGHEKIRELSNAGHLAATRIIRRFVRNLPPLRGGNPMGWENHRWIRLRLLMALLEESLPKVRNALTAASPGTPLYEEQARAAASRDQRQYPLDEAAQVQAMLDALGQLSDLADTVDTSGTARTAPTPLPELKIRSRL